MSHEYDQYLREHRSNVLRAGGWIINNIPNDKFLKLFPDFDFYRFNINLQHHDESKYSIEEYNAYDSHFYFERTPEVEQAFEYAWLHHVHNNPHHWQHWVLIDGANDEEGHAIEIPDVYIVEMISDWWSFSWKNYIKSNNPFDLYEIYNWYDERENKIVLHQNTKNKVDTLLDFIGKELDKIKF